MNSITVGNLKAILSLDTTNFDKGVTSSEANAKKLADRLSKDLAPSQARINSLIRDFAGNKDIARALEYATAIGKVSDVSKLTASEQTRANKVFAEASEKLKALGLGTSDVAVKLNAYAAATKQVKKPTDELGGSMTSLISKAKSLAGVFGVTLGAGALIGFAKQTFDAADQIGDLATKMGVSTDAAQRFQFAARQSGAEIEDVSRAIVTMNNSLAEGDKSTVGALSAAGLKFADIRAKKPEEAFRAIADAIERIPDPMLQSKVAMELFGKSGAELLPMIREGSLRAADGVSVMSDETVKSLKDAKQAWENFWNDVTIVTGNAIAEIMPQIKQMLNDLRVGFGFIAGLVIPGFGNPFGVAKALVQANDSAKQKPFSDLQSMMTDPAAMSSHGPKINFQTKEEREADEKRIKDLQKAEQAAEERYQALWRQRTSGLSDSDRERMAFDAEFKKREGLTSAYALMRGLVSGSAWSTIDAMTGGGLTFGREIGSRMIADAVNNRPIPSMDLPMAPQKPRGPMSLAELLSGVTIPGYNTKDLLKQGLGGAMNMLPQTILQAITGGGSIGKSIGSLFGTGIGGAVIGQSKEGVFSGGLGKMLQGAFGKNIGGMVANFIPGIGALLGPALGKLFSSIGNIGANTTKQGRVDFAKQLGFESLDNLYNKLRSLGPEGDRLVNTALNVIGKKDKAANEKWMKDVTAFFDRLEKVPGKVNELSQALGKFGGAIPKQLDPLLDSILADKNLDPALRRQLEGMRKPSWQAAQDFASSVGINLGALGPGFNQSRLADQAFSLKRGIDLLSRFAGSDQNAILRDMADEFSALAQDAKKNNVALPRAVQAFLRQIDEMGLLLDENGDRLDLSLLQFADIEDESLKEVVSLLEQIRDLLSPRPAPTPGAPGGPGGPPRPAPPTDPDNPDPGDPYDPRGPIRQPDLSGFGALSLPDIGDMPGFAGFGGTGQAVTASAGVTNIYAIDAASFETFMSQRGGAEVVVRTMGPVIERWGKAQ